MCRTLRVFSFKIKKCGPEMELREDEPDTTTSDIISINPANDTISGNEEIQTRDRKCIEPG